VKQPSNIYPNKKSKTNNLVIFTDPRAYTVQNGGAAMKDYISERAVELARYIIDTKATVRDTAKKFHVSKSTVHKDVTDRLMHINMPLAKEVHAILDSNKAERHIRGGLATQRKYANIDGK
jgi:putative DeoR family transcriptional regulator (stage III sporulation protein D)